MTYADLEPVVVRENQRLGTTGLWLSWDRDFDFHPGQVVPLTVDPQLPPRWYSLASGAVESFASVLYSRVADGALTPRLAELVPGDRLWIGSPQGSFVGKKGAAVWLANGTGVAPFLAMARSGLSKNKILVQGARTVDDLFFREEWSERLGVSYIPCCSREKADGIFPGRLTKYLETQPWQTDVPYFLCGSAEMIVEVRDFLIRGGVPFSQIHSEVYF